MVPPQFLAVKIWYSLGSYPENTHISSSLEWILHDYPRGVFVAVCDVPSLEGSHYNPRHYFPFYPSLFLDASTDYVPCGRLVFVSMSVQWPPPLAPHGGVIGGLFCIQTGRLCISPYPILRLLLYERIHENLLQWWWEEFHRLVIPNSLKDQIQ